MYLVVIAWVYVASMMAVAEATASNGTLLGALVTFVLYGLLPVALVVYLLGTPARRRALRKRESAERGVQRADSALPPDAGGHAPGAAEPDSVAPVRKEP
jgi:membrane protein implicated in regulation of membrane protease activity